MATGLFNLKQQLQGLIQKAWTGTQKTNFVEYLVVAGGGAGGSGSGGGGGAGGLLQGITPVIAGTSITVTVGAGASSYVVAPSSVFGNITAIGGGSGNTGGNGALSGGSGAGGESSAGYTIGGQGTFGQGNAGGNYYSASPYYYCAGGGGAGTVGLNSTATFAGNGGAGIASAINGTVTVYSGGGGGAAYSSGTGATGGVGGGGAGANGAGGTNGTANTGGGGGGGGTSAGGTGGSGIVIISYPDIYSAPTFGGANSPTASTSGSGSFSLNGSNQYVTYPQNSAFNLGTNNFTVEGWFNSASFGAGQFIISQWAAASYGYAFSISNSTTITFEYYSGGTYYNRNYTVSTLSTNTWYHIAWVRNSGTTTVYLNGVALSTTSDNNSITSSTQLVYVGVNNDGHNAYWNGNISNLRFVNGTAVYTSNFTPSTKPLTAITNTVLLLSTVSPSAFNDSSTNAFTPTVTGSPTWNQLSPFATGLGYKNRVYTWTGSGTVTF